MKFISAGNFIIDELLDGQNVRANACGPVGYAYGGMRLFTDDCQMVANVGSDIFEAIAPWANKNNIPINGLMARTDITTKIILSPTEDGGYTYRYALTDWLGAINFGMLRLRPEDLVPFLDGVQGIYIDQPIETTFIKKIAALRETYHFKLMWEIQYETGKELYFSDKKEQRVKQFLNLLPLVDMFSMNLREVAELFGTQSDTESVELIKSLSTPCFLRAGNAGSYWIENGEAIFVPSVRFIDEPVDTMGCGNCSTAAALVARVEGHTPYEICAYANVAAAYNLEQYGPIPLFSEQLRRDALAAVARLCENNGLYSGSQCLSKNKKQKGDRQ